MPKIGSRRLQDLQKQVEERTYEPLDALELLKKTATAKFPESAEVHIRLGIDPKYTDQQLRTTVALPKGTGQEIRVAVVARVKKWPKPILQALMSGGGSEELIAEIQQGRMDFDLVIATPDMMPQVAKVGRILGPRGLMPSPKAGTVTFDLEQAIGEFKAGKLEFRADRSGIVHVIFGKASFSADDLLTNLKALQDTIDRTVDHQGQKAGIGAVSMCLQTMGPSIQIDINSLRDLKLAEGE